MKFIYILELNYKLMDFCEYLEKMKLNQNDPDYQIEDFWLGFKGSMLKFYHLVGVSSVHIKKWSNILNKIKQEKNYNLIERKIKEFICIYTIDVMKMEKLNDNTSSILLMTNIKRWNKLSNKFSFEQTESQSNSTQMQTLVNSELVNEKNINTKVFELFEIFHNIKKKLNPKHEHILKLFKNIDIIFIDNWNDNKFEYEIIKFNKILISESFSNGLFKVLEFIESIIGYEQVLNCILDNFPEISISSRDKNISWLKLYKKFSKIKVD